MTGHARLVVVTGLAAGLVVISVAHRLWRSPSSRPPAVLVVLIDSLRPDHINSYGYGVRETTPGLDALASDGVRFAEAFANAPWTVPSVASLLTGCYPSSVGYDMEAHLYPQRRLSNSTSVTTMAEAFAGAGYQTAAFTAGGAVTADYGFARGFGHFEETSPINGEDLAHMVPRALRWIEAARDAPFFLFLHTYEVHLPHTHGPGTNDDVRAAYDADLRFAYETLSRIWQAVREHRRSEDSIIVVLADPGEALGQRVVLGRSDDHGYHLHDELLRVPMIVVAPGRVRPRAELIEQPVQIVDLLPTVLELAGIEWEGEPRSGRSVVPLLRGSGLDDRPVLAEAPFQGPGWLALRWGGYKWIEWPDQHQHVGPPMWWDADAGPRSHALYDLTQDPGETMDVSPDHPDVASRLQRLGHEMRAASGDGCAAASTTGRPEVDKDLWDRLRALGYIR